MGPNGQDRIGFERVRTEQERAEAKRGRVDEMRRGGRGAGRDGTKLNGKERNGTERNGTNGTVREERDETTPYRTRRDKTERVLTRGTESGTNQVRDEVGRNCARA